MKSLLTESIKFLSLAFLILSTLQATSQEKLTSAQWQEDLKFLQNTVNETYPFLFKKVTKDAWNGAVEKLHGNIPNLQDHEVMVGFARVVSLFKYGHTNIYLGSGEVPHHKLPINLYHFKDGVYIEGVHKDHKKILGGKLLKIAGVPVEQVLDLIKPTVPVENEQFFKAYGLAHLTIPEILHAQGVTETLSKTMTVTVEKDGKTFDHTLVSVVPDAFNKTYGFITPTEDWLSSRLQDTKPNYLKYLDKMYYYEYLPSEKAVYVRHSQIYDDPTGDIQNFYKKVFEFIENNDVEKLILDVRLNGGGNNYLNKPIVTGVIKSEKINKPGGFFVIVGKRTFSACQNLINELQNYTDVLFVGEPSAENQNFYGDAKRIRLPNSKFTVALSYAWWQDIPQWEGQEWTQPQLPVEMTFEDYRTNQDPVLQRALDFETNGFIIDPMAHLTQLFGAGKYEQVFNDAFAMVQDARYEFVDFEKEFNRAGYNLMGGPQHGGAIMIFEMTTKSFPESVTTWNNLAQAYMISKEYEKAQVCYEKIIALAPDSLQARSAKEKLQALAKD